MEEEVRRILKENENVNVNWTDSLGSTALHSASSYGHDKIVTMLLAHPDIDVNQKDQSPFLLACANVCTTCVRLLLKDARVRVNEPANDAHGPLWYAAFDGRLEMIKWWIASGRERDLGPHENAVGVAMKYRYNEVVSLLERFKADPTQTKSEIRKELCWFDEMAADMFALVIFLCDGLMRISEETTNEAARFFRIIQRLPMELQMILCLRAVGSTGE